MPCGWCLDGNHLPREEEPDFEDEMGIRRRGRPATPGCVAGQVWKGGDPRAGLPKGQCPCHDAGHDRSKLAAG